MLGFRERESQALTIKPALIFNWLGTTKDRLHCMSVKKSINKYMGSFMKFYPLGTVKDQ